MKSILILVTGLFSFSAFAGGTGGGGVLKGFALNNSPEIVYNLGQNGDKIRFAHGRLQPDGWKIQKIEIPEAVVSAEPLIFEALMKSEQTKDWSTIQYPIFQGQDLK
jgi:hypothetical protein